MALRAQGGDGVNAIVEYNKTAAALADLRARYGQSYDVRTSDGMRAAREARAEIKRHRVELEKMRVELKAPLLERGRLVDEEAKRITAELLSLEEPIDAAIKAEEERKEREKAEAEAAKRVLLEASQRQCNELRALVVQAVNTTPAHIQSLIAKATAYAVPDNAHRGDVEDVRKQTLVQLDTLLARSIAHEVERVRLEAERAELERLQREAETKAAAERERLAAEARVAREQIEAERRAAEEARAAADAKAKVEREVADREAAKLRAEQERQAREAREREEARLRTEREKLEGERRAAEEMARAAEQERQRKLGGYELLMTFCRRHRDDAEFTDIAIKVADWLRETEWFRAQRKGAA